MRFGLFGGAQSSPSDPARGYNDYLNFLLEAEAPGGHGCFLTEHHFTGWGQVSASPHMLSWLDMLSWLAARTTRPRPGTAVMVLAWHNPMLLAEQAATVDVLSGGRGHVCAVQPPRAAPANARAMDRPFRRPGTRGILTRFKGTSHDR